jgi:SAM-dependent methyltransferase
VRDFGIRTATAREAVGVFYGVLRRDGQEPLAHWQQSCGQVYGRDFDKFAHLERGQYHFRRTKIGTVPHAEKLARRYGVSTDALSPEALLFALQTYYATLVGLLVRRFGSWRVDDLPGGNPFDWRREAPSDAVEHLIDRLTAAMSGYDVASLQQGDGENVDLLKPLYQDLFPRPLRHRLGEYYTPDWLARHVLDQVGFTGAAGQRLLDPACGSGTFLMLAIQRIRAASPHPSSLILHRFPVVGLDLNPLAVMTARANYLIALQDWLPAGEQVEAPVYLADSILDRPPQAALAEPFDFVVGNPPWIAWDNLPDAVRRATRPLWERYGLFSLSGSDARHGGGKKDLSMLMLYATADRYLKCGGRLGMVITQTVFQTKGAGDGFRRFRLGPEGEPLKVLRVDDLAALRPFGDAANWTSTVVIEKGAATEYPVPYVKWGERREERGERRDKNAECGMMNDECQKRGPSIHHSSFIIQHSCLARPIDPARPSSPWLVLPDKSSGGDTMPVGPSDYTAHLGANSGGANGVYWLEVLRPAEGGVLVRNIAAKGKRSVEVVEQVIEPDLLYPLLRWSDVKRYGAAARCHILLAQDVATRTGIDECVMRERYPRTLAYLERFRELLTSRAAYRRYQHGGPFYSMYNVGQYTVAPIKVVWRRMDSRITAAVVEEVVPQETCVLVACGSADEAHYLCAVLNSRAINELVSGHSVRAGKGFGTPSMLDYLPIRRFRPDDPRHQKLASLSRQAHEAARSSVALGVDPGEGRQVSDMRVAGVQHGINALAERLLSAPR